MLQFSALNGLRVGVNGAAVYLITMGSCIWEGRMDGRGRKEERKGKEEEVGKGKGEEKCVVGTSIYFTAWRVGWEGETEGNGKRRVRKGWTLFQ